MQTEYYRDEVDRILASLREKDPKAAGFAEKYAEALIDLAEGNGNTERANEALERLPKHNEVSPEVADLLAELVSLSNQYRFN